MDLTEYYNSKGKLASIMGVAEDSEMERLIMEESARSGIEAEEFARAYSDALSSLKKIDPRLKTLEIEDTKRDLLTLAIVNTYEKYHIIQSQ